MTGNSNDSSDNNPRPGFLSVGNEQDDTAITIEPLTNASARKARAMVLRHVGEGALASGLSLSSFCAAGFILSLLVSFTKEPTAEPAFQSQLLVWLCAFGGAFTSMMPLAVNMLCMQGKLVDGQAEISSSEKNKARTVGAGFPVGGALCLASVGMFIGASIEDQLSDRMHQIAMATTGISGIAVIAICICLARLLQQGQSQASENNSESNPIYRR